jgi:NAD(P)-dependent dehydrogenase (short-subunit alcohol dehydrogenase family)
VIVAGRNRDALEVAYRDDPGVTAETIDLLDEATIAALATRIGSVDHVISTGSARARGLVRDLAPETVGLSFQTKVVGPLMLAKHFADRMPADGSFVLFSGHSARKSVPGMLAVGATNAAVDAVVKSLAVELAPLRVNAVSPGVIDTGAYDALGEKKAAFLEHAAATNPVRRIGTVEDVASAVLFALTNTFVTGSSIAVDGGEPLV